MQKIEFTKPMIDLVFAIRRLCPSDLKPSIKLANPELFDELKKFHHSGADTISSVLIKELFILAGDDWFKALLSNDDLIPRQKTKVYRGQPIFESVSAPVIKKSKQDSKKKIYRGRVVED